MTNGFNRRKFDFGVKLLPSILVMLLLWYGLIPVIESVRLVQLWVLAMQF